MFHLPAYFLSDPASPVFLTDADPALRILVACLYVLVGVAVMVVAALLSHLLLKASKEEADRRAKQIGVLLIAIVLVLTGTTVVDNAQQEVVAADKRAFRAWLDNNYPQLRFDGVEAGRLLAGQPVRTEGTVVREWSLVPAGSGIPGYWLEVTVPDD